MQFFTHNSFVPCLSAQSTYMQVRRVHTKSRIRYKLHLFSSKYPSEGPILFQACALEMKGYTAIFSCTHSVTHTICMVFSPLQASEQSCKKWLLERHYRKTAGKKCVTCHEMGRGNAWTHTPQCNKASCNIFFMILTEGVEAGDFTGKKSGIEFSSASNCAS